MTDETETKPNSHNVDTYDASAVLAEEQPKAEENPAMQKAVEQGWAPKDQWRGPEQDWVDYGEFNRRGELMSHISRTNDRLDHVSKENNELKQALNKFQELNNNIINDKYQNILGALKEQRAEAISMGDGEKVNEIDDKIDTFKKEMDQNEPTKEPAKDPEQPQDVPAEYYDFANKHEWLATEERIEKGLPVDHEKTQVVEGIGRAFAREYAASHGGQAPSAVQILDRIESRLSEIYPSDSTQQGTRQPVPGIVEPSGDNNRETNSNQRKSKYTIADLDPADQSIVRKMAEGSNLDVQEYIDQLVENDGLKI